MKETEVKFYASNFNHIRSRLKKLGAKLEWRGIEKSYFYDTPSEDLRRKHYNLRLREWFGHSNTLTLKTPTSKKDGKYKVRDEYQIEVNDLARTREILQKLGFGEYFRYRKHREEWKVRGAKVELDRFQGCSIVEIEGGVQKINELAKLLGLDWQKSTTKSYIQLWRELR